VERDPRGAHRAAEPDRLGGEVGAGADAPRARRGHRRERHGAHRRRRAAARPRPAADGGDRAAGDRGRRPAHLRRARLGQGAREDGALRPDLHQRLSAGGMEHSPPPFFKRGPAPLVRLFFFASLSLALLVLDARFRYTEAVRGALALVVYPIQRIAVAPIDFLEGVGGYFSSQSQLLDENAALRAQALANSQDALRFQAAQAESAQLRRMLGAAEKLEVRAMPAEILYAGRDPYSHKVFIDRGGRHGVRAGRPDDVQPGKERRLDKTRRARVKEAAKEPAKAEATDVAR